MARISSAVTIFMGVLVVGRSPLAGPYPYPFQRMTRNAEHFRERPTTNGQRPILKQKDPPRWAEGHIWKLSLRSTFRPGLPRECLHPAVLHAVSEIHNQSNRQPDKQPSPVHPT